MSEVIVSLGSNINPDENIRQACSILENEYEVIARSPFVKTKPIGFTQQPDFINGCITVKTSLSQAEFSEYLKKTEIRMGRIRTENKNGPRTIDLDIVVWDGEIVNNDYYEKSFVQDAVDQLLKQI